MTDEGFDARTYQAKLRSSLWFVEKVLQYVDVGRPVRILDLGCGDGTLVGLLAERLCSAEIIGVDISDANIQIAREAHREAPYADHVSFVVEDYMNFRTEPFDVIVSFSAIQFIEGDTCRLFAKIAGDTRPGGVIVNLMAYRCLMNRLLVCVRHVFRALRCRLSDKLVRQVIRWTDPDNLDEEAVRHRAEYMYVLPSQYDSDKLHAWWASTCGVRPISVEPGPDLSFAGMRHRLTVFRKNGA